MLLKHSKLDDALKMMYFTIDKVRNDTCVVYYLNSSSITYHFHLKNNLSSLLPYYESTYVDRVGNRFNCVHTL